MNATEICFTPALELARRIRVKELSPVEVTRIILERIEALNPRLNAYCTLTAEAALEAARGLEKRILRGEDPGLLGGVPYSIKDLILTRGVRTMRGSKIYEHFIPEEDAPVVLRLRDAGGILLGKTCTSEFGWKGVTDTVVTGITRNPWDLNCTPGGSSGGAAAQVAAGLGPVAVGTDGGGSIRIPAGFSGIFGIKPSFGRVPTYPASGHDQLSHAGPLTRTVADAALMLGILAGPHESDRFSLEAPPQNYLARLQEGVKGLRVAWSPDLGYARVHPEVHALTERAARAFESLGCLVEEQDPGLGDPTDAFMVIYLMGVAGGLSALLEEWEPHLDPGLVRVIREGRTVSGLQLTQAQQARHQLWDRTRRFFERYDLLLTPTLAVPAFPVGQLTPEGKDADLRSAFAWTPFTYPFNLTGNPAASLPVGFTTTGLPVGLQVVGRRFADLTVLQASAAFETAHPWAHSRPPL
ncbi:MAG: amidase [Deltaproteobacteria bacterium]|nr:amidase [Deltaproteobacteria bacterium]